MSFFAAAADGDWIGEQDERRKKKRRRPKAVQEQPVAEEQVPTVAGHRPSNVLQPQSVGQFFVERVADEQTLLLGSLYAKDVPRFRAERSRLVAERHAPELTLRFFESGRLRRARRRGGLGGLKLKRREREAEDIMSLSSGSASEEGNSLAEEMVRERITYLHRNLRSHPCSHLLWLELACLQDKLVMLGAVDSETGAERKLEILARGIREIRQRKSNEGFGEILETYAKVCLDHLSPSEAKVALTKLVELDDRSLVLRWAQVDLELSSLTTFRCDRLSVLLTELTEEFQGSPAAVELLCARVRLLKAAGHTESAVAISVAFLEGLGLNRQHALDPREKDQVLKVFWESAIPRMGEPGAPGLERWLASAIVCRPVRSERGGIYQGLPMVKKLQRIILESGSVESREVHEEITGPVSMSSWYKDEVSSDAVNWRPQRSLMGQDLESVRTIQSALQMSRGVVLYEDLCVRGILPGHGDAAKDALIVVKQLLHVLGIRTGRGSSRLCIAGNVSWELASWLQECGENTRQWPPIVATYMRSCCLRRDIVALPESKRRFVASLLADILSRVPGSLTELEKITIYFQAAAYGASAAKRAARNFLKSKGDSLSREALTLYCALGGALADCGEAFEARKVFTSALSMAPRASVGMLLSAYVEFELDQLDDVGDGNARSAITRALLGDNRGDSFEKSSLLEALGNLEKTEAGNGKDWLSVRIAIEGLSEDPNWTALLEEASQAEGLTEIAVLENMAVWLFRAWCRLETSSTTQLRGVLERALTINPQGDLVLALYAALVMYRCRAGVPATSFAYKLAGNAKADASTAFVCAKIARSVKDTRRAVAILERSVSSFKSDAALWLELITSLVEVEATDAARKAFVRAIGACPWSKRLWIAGVSLVGSSMSADEISDVLALAEEKGILLRCPYAGASSPT